MKEAEKIDRDRRHAIATFCKQWKLTESNIGADDFDSMKIALQVSANDAVISQLRKVQRV